MDPDEALRDARRAVRMYRDAMAGDMDGAMMREAEAGGALVELFDALDEWITRGGFLPEPWRAER